MATFPEDMSVAIDELGSAIAEVESRLESARAERDEAKARQIELEIENSNLRRELNLARGRQNASAEILRTIADLSGDADQLLHLIAETTARLFGAPSVTMVLADGENWGKTINFGASSERVGARVIAERPRFGGDNLPGTVFREGRQIHIPDLDNIDPAMAHWPVMAARAEGTRTVAATPLRRKGKPFGVLIVYRSGLAPFTDGELALQQSFADQAVIAIQNAQLFNETRESLERQTATADILKVIASSPSDVQPVFQAIASTAKRLLSGFSTTVLHFVGDELHLVAYTPTSPEADEALKASFPRKLAEFPTFALVRNGETIQFADTEAEGVPEANRELARLRGFRSVLFTPLMNHGTPVGMISVTRDEPGAFAPHHVQLLQTFADQAVIAIENTRLFNETEEALERQTATAEILKVIASSPSDVQPVFDAIAHSANRLVGGFSTAVHRVIDEIDHLVAFTPTNPEADGALKAAFPRHRNEVPAIALIKNGETAQIADCETADARIRELGRARGWRSVTYTPLMSQGTFIGFIACTRRDPGVLADDHVQLLRTFADQAVIAIENTRLFNETKDALEHQKASSDILRVISGSVADAQPVFDKILDSCNHLFGSDETAVLLLDGEDTITLGAYVGKQHEAVAASFPAPLDKSPAGRALRERRVVHYTDVANDPQLTRTVRRVAQLAGYESMAYAPMVSNGRGIGAIGASRNKGSFSHKELMLLQTFADQAVIAIENARLFNETQEALERQTTTADILKVIASSPSDVQPVFDAIARSANRLIGGFSAAVFRYIDGKINLAAFTPTDAEGDAVLQSSFPVPLAEFPPYHLTRDGAPAELPDTELEPAAREIARARGYRSMLFAPLMNEGEAVGIITVTRVAPGPFGEQHTRLLQMFADQAVIAVRNVGLFNEVQARTEDLSESLRQQTAVGDVLKTISRSTFELQPVLDTLVNSAAQLCDADMAFIMRRVGDEYRAGAAVGYTDAYIDFLTNHPLAVDRGTVTGRAVLERRPVQILDVVADPEYTLHETTTLARQRTTLGVPLLRESEPIGVIVLARQRVEAFTEKQIELVATFADQAVIAIENVRLFNEVQQRTEDLSETLQQQTATGEVLKVIASSPTDVNPALQAIVKSACTFCDAYDAGVLLKIGDDLHFSAHHGPIRTGQEPRPISREWVVGRSVVDKVPVQVPNFLAPEAAEFPEGQRQSREQGHRCTLSVPLLREGEAIGALALRRLEPVAFSDKQIALLQTFADQAVIAIGNVRLFEEVQTKTRDLQEALTYQTGSANILQVIASSPTDVGPVLNAIVESACELCDANDTIVFLREGDRLSYKAHHGPIPVVFGENRAINRGYVAGRSMIDKIPIHVPDVFSEDAVDFPESRELSRRDGIRSILCVPMLRENESIGAILLRRTEVHPFTDKQIALLQTFANQAVIAIGNVRLFEEVQARTRELTEALEQQTATSEVLETISASTGELDPVFSKMLENATRICDAKFGTMNLYEEGGFRTVAMYNAPKAYIDTRIYESIRPHPASGLGTVEKTHRTVHIDDIRTQPPYIEGNPNVRALADLAGARTVVVVPMLKEDELIGTITIFRQEVKPFTEKQTELVASFANQAVIAIENARLLNELRQRTNDLSKSLDDLRTAQDRLVQTEKLASLGQLTAGIAHEIKNPLNFVNNFAALSAELTDELNDVLKPTGLAEKVRAEVDELTGLLKDNLKKVVQHGKRADSIVKNMLLHSREGGGEHRPSDINTLIDESLNLAYHGARAEKPGFNITLERDFDPEAGQLDLFPQETTRVFLNLISNGFYAANKRSKEGGEPGFEPTLRVSTKNLGQAVEIRIRDNGTGIPSEVKEKMFNPFFTTKPAGEGTGLGLSMSHDIIVKQHGGTIDVDTEQGHFTEFRIVLPRTSNFAEKSRGQP